MITIGTFTRNDEGAYVGAIRTLTLSTKGVRIRPIEATGPRGPDFRVEASGIELGAAWRKTAQDEREYLSVRLDDPAFAGPVHALLVETAAGFGLIWSRWTQA